VRWIIVSSALQVCFQAFEDLQAFHEHEQSTEREADDAQVHKEVEADYCRQSDTRTCAGL